MKDVAIVGAGIAGMATAARLQAIGLTTVVLEAHGKPGGCAGYYRCKGFSFDVGATTLVDFANDGIGGELLRNIGMPPLEGEHLPGYKAWLPDRTVVLCRDQGAWSAERLSVFGDTSKHHRFWQILDDIAAVFWSASRYGITLPCRRVGDFASAARAVGLGNFMQVKYLWWTMGDLLRACGLRNDHALVGLLSILIEDTVHSTVDAAPLINAALGVTIRGAGIFRALGGMRGFWEKFVMHYNVLGGELKTGRRVERITGAFGNFRIETNRDQFDARQVVAAVPAALVAKIAPEPVAGALAPYIRRDAGAQGGAIVVFLGVPEAQVDAEEWTHHQLLQDYSEQLGSGNNMFISVSAPGDFTSAPPGFRAVMISTHCDLTPWEGLSHPDYQRKKEAAGARLIALARRVYPNLGADAVVRHIATPRTYERFTRRPRGAVGGTRLALANANQNAIPHDLGVPGFYLAGDTTWPGLGTVACVLGSKIVAAKAAATAAGLRRTAAYDGLEESHGTCCEHPDAVRLAVPADAG